MMETEYILARKVLQLANLILQNRNQDLKKLGLTAEQADTLLYFSKHHGGYVVDLKSHLGITHQTARGIVARMVEKGLLTTLVSVQDSRYKQVFLTEKGKELCVLMEQNGTYTGKKLLHGMNQVESRQFLNAITQALENLNFDK